MMLAIDTLDYDTARAFNCEISSNQLLIENLFCLRNLVAGPTGANSLSAAKLLNKTTLRLESKGQRCV
jgi:hypothetical protein